jgi:hypothetical protein
MTEQKISAGDRIHLLDSMSIPTSEHQSAVYPRGTTIEVTPELLEMSKNRHGESWLDYSDDDQRARFGAVKFGRGEAPADVLWWNKTPGDGLWNIARDQEMERIATLPNAEERAAATDKARETFGRRNNVTTLSSWGTQR